MSMPHVVAGLACALVLAPHTAAAAEEPQLTRDDAAVVAADYDADVRDDAAYAGVRVTADGRVEVFAAGDDASLRRAANATGKGATFRFLPARYPLSDLLAVRDRIRRNADALVASGIDIASWGPDVVTNTVRIGVEDPTPDEVAALRATYGPSVRVEADRKTRPVSRLYDSAPWNGGDFIAMDNGKDCSTGPPVMRVTGQTYLLTAGHCFVSTTNSGMSGYTYRVFQGSHMMGTGGSPFMGWAAAQRVHGGYDVALISTSSSRLAWRSQTATQTTGATPQYAVQSSVVGASVCASGAHSGERCGAIVKYVNQDTRSFGGVVSINMVAAENAGVALVGPGDSGGPVYQVHASGLLMTGMIVQARDDSNNPGANALICPQGDQAGRGTSCTDVVWYHDLPSLLGHLGVTLKTI